MPFQIVRNDIVNMQVDAIVNTANPKPVIGYGLDAGIHKKAGPKLLEARKKIGNIRTGHVAITPGFLLDAEYVIHTVGPVWIDGSHGEERLLRQCYDRALMLAWWKRCESIAFPLISAGNHGFPKNLALQTALSAISEFLMKHEMTVYLVVFSRDAYQLSEKLFQGVSSFIDEHYVQEANFQQYGVPDKCSVRHAQQEAFLQEQMRRRQEAARFDDVVEDGAPAPARVRRAAPKASRPTFTGAAPTVPMSAPPQSLEDMLKETDAGFSETLLKLIDKTGKKDSEIYKRANIDRKLFSKIRNNKFYQPSKATALAFAIALELDLEETRDFIGRAGFALSKSSKFDIIIEYFIRSGNYNVHEINMTLFEFDQSLLGA